MALEKSALLQVDDLHAWYGQGHVLHGVSLQVQAGEIVSVLGRNGAGRSTLLRALMGMLRREGGIQLAGQDISRLATYEIAHRGVAYVPESRDVFPSLTVDQNLLLGRKAGRAAADGWGFEDMYAMFPALKKRRDVAAGALSGGEQQMLALARALMGNPRLVLVDEPTEGLAPQMVEQVAHYLAELRRRGVAVLLVEQKQAIALDIAQRVYVMGRGEMVFHGTPQELRADQAVQREWLAL